MSTRSLIVIVLSLIFTGCQTSRECCGIYVDVDPRPQHDSADADLTEPAPTAAIADNREQAMQYTQAIMKAYARRQLVEEERKLIHDLASGRLAPEVVNLYDKLIRAAVMNGDSSWEELEISPEAFNQLIDRYYK